MAELKKSLGYGTIIAISITSMIGTGMFVGTAKAADYSGNMSLIGWALLSLMTIYIAYCFGELVSMFPSAGGVYEFAKQTYGRFLSFMIGWITWLVGNITTSVVIVTALSFLIPENFTLSFFPNMSTDLISILAAVIIILILNYIAFIGIDSSAKILVFFAAVTLSVLLVVLIPGCFSINFSNFHPFFFKGTNVQNGLLIFAGMFIIVETYFGWESATFLAEETKDAQKVIPRSLVITSIIVAVFGVLLSVVTLGNINWEILKLSSTPFHDLSVLFYSERVWEILSVSVFITMIGSAAGGIVSTPRLLLALARDKLFMNGFADIHETKKTPYKAIMFQTIITIIIVIIGFAEYDTLISMLVPLALIMYISVLLAVTILRFKKPNHPRPFKAPFGKIGPIIISGFFIAVITAWILEVADAINLIKLLGSFILFGVPIYLLLMFYYDPDVIIKLNDVFAYFTLLFERILIPRHIDRRIFNHLGNIQGKTILEFGCGVGTFTKELAVETGPKGSIYATDVSYTQVKIANKRIAKRGHLHVHFIHDIHQVNRVHHSIPEVDAIVSIGMLGYLQDIRKVLTEMHNILPENGKIIFMDYIDLFKIIPNVSWLSHEDGLVALFRDCGFSVTFEKVKGRFWNYLFVYGIKTDQDVPFI